jgi:hypothetical protein
MLSTAGNAVSAVSAASGPVRVSVFQNISNSIR